MQVVNMTELTKSRTEESFKNHCKPFQPFMIRDEETSSKEGTSASLFICSFFRRDLASVGGLISYSRVYPPLCQLKTHEIVFFYILISRFCNYINPEKSHASADPRHSENSIIDNIVSIIQKYCQQITLRLVLKNRKDVIFRCDAIMKLF